MKKKLLVLGGKPIGSVEIVKRAKQLGFYTIVTDYLPANLSPAKGYADETWNISTADIDVLVDKCKKENVCAVTTGVHEFNINRMLELTEILHLPCYCKPSTWVYCDDKVQFKHLCQQNGIPVAQQYELERIVSAKFPLITKPVDGSGSRGFHICNNAVELYDAYQNAKLYSPSQRVLIEDFIPYNAVIIHYTMIAGKCFYSGMSDKLSVKFANTGASVMGIQTFPSKGENVYLQTLNKKVCLMFENAGFTDGPIWIEASFDGTVKFVFNEMGYRFGGSLTYYPVRYFYGIDQLDLYLNASLGRTSLCRCERQKVSKQYCILPLHIHAGNIVQIKGIEQLQNNENYYAMAQVHFVGDEIQNWGSAQQVFCYLHLLYDNINELQTTVHLILQYLQALDADGNNLLFTLFDIDDLYE